MLGDGFGDPVLSISTYTNYSTSDYNGFRPNPNVADAFEWNSPPNSVAADYEHDPVAHHFKSFQEYSQATHQEQHSILIDFDAFANVRIPDKSDPQHLYKPDDFDFRLKAGSAAIDAGAVLPSITDDFTGRAPDLGAYELDRPLPHYGPRN
jgi:hypothetical protein